jgi:hypothetical protein
MLRIATLATAITWCAATSAAQSQPITPTPAEILGRVMSFRMEILADKVPIDVCKIDMFWKADSTPITVPDLLPPRHQHRSECRTQKALPIVEMAEIEISGDSVVVFGSTQHGGVSRTDTYVFLNRRPNIVFKEYRISWLTYFK